MRWITLPLVAATMLGACSPAVPPGQSGAAGAQSARQTPLPTLVMMIRVEPTTIAAKIFGTGGVATAVTRRLFNAGLALTDDRAIPRPYLAEALPQLGSETWQVFPDGQMETVYRLRRGLLWHDGTPLSVADFAFALRIYTTPELGAAASAPQSLMESVSAPDEQTLLLQWRRPYPEAWALRPEDFAPLPRHVLEDSFLHDPVDTFRAHPFWTREYVGLGPYALEQWEPGAFMKAAAFDRHVLGKPKIDRVQILWNSDPNVVLANLVSGTIHLTADSPLHSSLANVLSRAWAPRRAGSVLLTPDSSRATQVQLREEAANPKALLDVRVRKALAHAVEKQALNHAFFEGAGIMADTMIPPTVDYYAALDRALAKYPYDLRQSEQLMKEAGFSKGADGVYASAANGRLNVELKTNAGGQSEAEMSVLASGWRQAGFEIREAVNPAALATDGQTRALFSGLFTATSGLGEEILRIYSSANIPRPENRWIGRNRAGWVNGEFDQLVEAFNSTLDRSRRNEQAIRMAQLFSEELPEISLYFDPDVTAHVAALRGPQIVAPRGTKAWNVHEWELH